MALAAPMEGSIQSRYGEYMNSNEEQSKVLDCLARKLVANHIRLCVPTRLHQDAREILLGPSIDLDLPRAVIVAVGAGASADAVGLPMGKEASDILKDKLRIPAEYLENELRRLSIQYRLRREEFETQLLALGKFGGPRLLESLTAIFGRRYYTATCYEIISHLFKHRFVDAIINFNFDEVLDQAIDDEVGEENYWRIVSDGDLQGTMKDMWDNHRRLRLPLYIKPHGTASHASSLRFTREAYFLLPDDIHTLLLECFTKTPVTLLIVGFGMQSVEFSDIIGNAATSTDIEVIAIDTNAEVLDRLPPTVPLEKRMLAVPSVEGLSEVFEHVWEAVRLCFAKEGFVRGTERHKLIAALFDERPDPQKAERDRGSDLLSYLRDRTIVELALAVAKARGFVNIAQMDVSRPGKYLRRYRRANPSSRETLYTLCKSLELSQVGYSRDALRLLPIPSNDTKPSQLIVDRDRWDMAKEKLVRNVVAELTPARRRSVESHDGRRFFMEVLDAMYSGQEVEVFSSRDSADDLIFAEPQKLRTYVALHVYSTDMLRGAWNSLLCVAESAQWLLNGDIVKAIGNGQKRSMAVVLADLTHASDLMNLYRENNVAYGW
jgi:hypothetical protein